MKFIRIFNRIKTDMSLICIRIVKQKWIRKWKTIRNVKIKDIWSFLANSTGQRTDTENRGLSFTIEDVWDV